MGMTILRLRMCQDEHGPICEGITPPGTVGIQKADDDRVACSPRHEDVERPEIAVQQTRRLDFIQLLGMLTHRLKDRF